MLVISLKPNQTDINTLLSAFLLTVVPSGVEVVLGQDNKVSEPLGPDFLVMTPIRRERISTNVDTYADCYFTGSITGSVLTVTSTEYGQIVPGTTIWGEGILANTTVVRSSAPNVWLLSNTQTVVLESMAAGTQALTQSTKITFQIDVHGPNSADNAQNISTLFRDEVAVDYFTASNPAITPLYADDPRQMSFLNDQNQIERRWIVEALVQADQTTTIAFQFFDQATITPIDVQAAYPA